MRRMDRDKGVAIQPASRCGSGTTGTLQAVFQLVKRVISERAGEGQDGDIGPWEAGHEAGRNA